MNEELVLAIEHRDYWECAFCLKKYYHEDDAIICCEKIKEHILKRKKKETGK